MENKKLKVGLFIDTYFPMIDGVIIVVDNLARKLVKFCDVTVFAPEGRTKFDDSTLPYKVVRCTKSFPLKFLDYDLPLPKKDKTFIDKMEQSNLDIVHIHSPFSIGKMGVEYAKRHNIPVVGSLHSQYKMDFKKAVKINFIANLMVKKIIKTFNACNECWPVSEGVEKLFKDDYKLKCKTKVHHSATDFEKIDFSNEEIDTLTKKYNINNNEKILTFVGRLNSSKNIFFIEKALKKLKENNFKFKMFYIGTGPDQEKLKKLIKKDNLENEVYLTGKISSRRELAKYYAISHLFLFPSKYDTDGLVKYEAACYNTPTISLNNCISSFNIKDNVNGYVCEDSIDLFSQKIIDIFKDHKKYEQVCKQAKKDLYKTWDKAAEETLQDYYRLIDKNNNFCS